MNTTTKTRFLVQDATGSVYVYRAGRTNPDWNSSRPYAATQYVWTENPANAVSWATEEAAQRHADRTGGTVVPKPEAP